MCSKEENGSPDVDVSRPDLVTRVAVWLVVITAGGGRSEAAAAAVVVVVVVVALDV